MTAQDIRDELKKQPFEPLRFIVSDGSQYDIYHPDLCLVGYGSVVIGFAEKEGSPIFERTVRVDTGHISRILPLKVAQPAQGSNGTAH